MTIYDKIRDEKLQQGNYRESAKMSALSCGNIDKYEYLTVEEIRRSDRRGVVEQNKYADSPLEKALEKLTKTIED